MNTIVESQTVPSIGSVAPDFTLQSTSGESVTLSAFRGKRPVLLAFFPLAFTSTCTAELCSFSDNYDQFAGYNVAVLPISIDAVPSLKEFKAKYGMKTELLSDFKREAGNAYGVMFEDSFFTKRAYFLIDTNGVIRWVHVEDQLGHKRDDQEIIAEIKKL